MMNPRVSTSKSQIPTAMIQVSNSKSETQHSNIEVFDSKSRSAQKVTFGVSGNCDMCKDRIEGAAKSVNGVSSASWNSKTKKIDVEYNGSLTSLEIIQKAIAKAGHDTGKYKADDKVYDALPKCCLYRK
jgi:Cu(I)/Ag(I) efflux system membrane fusion protein